MFGVMPQRARNYGVDADHDGSDGDMIAMETKRGDWVLGNTLRDSERRVEDLSVAIGWGEVPCGSLSCATRRRMDACVETPRIRYKIPPGWRPLSSQTWTEKLRRFA